MVYTVVTHLPSTDSYTMSAMSISAESGRMNMSTITTYFVSESWI